MSIQTVRGKIEPAALGNTLMHEHTFIDAWAWGGGLEYNSIVDDEELLVEELRIYQQAGGAGLVDLMMIGLRPRYTIFEMIDDALSNKGN